MFQVEYELLDYRGNPTGCGCQITYWIESNLKDGGIERQISKLQKLLSIIGEQWLAANPGRVAEIADIVGCDGMNHRITRSE